MLGLANHAQAGSFEGVWKLESGKWGDLVYPAGSGEDSGASAYRVFTDKHHFFISSFPANSIFNANMTRYSTKGNVLQMEGIVVKNPDKHLPVWEWQFELEQDQLILEMDGMREVWVRVE
jgi:hypothetical protein